MIEQWIEMPNTHSDARAVNPAGPESRTHNLPWEVFESVCEDYRTWQQGGKDSKKSAEAVVVQAVDGEPARHPSNQKRLDEGLNFQTKAILVQLDG